MDYEICAYTPGMAAEWDEFVKERARNATFLHLRPYMDYHADRFTDASLVVRREGGGIAALLPASAHGGEVRSHGGLTYGGLLLPFTRLGGADVLTLMRGILSHYRSRGFTSLLYKEIPHIYHRAPAEDTLYALWRLGAITDHMDLAATADVRSGIGFDMSSRQNLRKGLKAGLLTARETDFGEFWQILGRCLAERHEATPVHTLGEMQRLASLFPDNIRLHTVRHPDGDLLGGMLVYLTDTCAHVQYTATTQRGRSMRCLAPLVDALIAGYCDPLRRPYFDYGTCNEDNGHVLNDGLLRQKEGFGCRGVVYPTLRLSL